MAEMSKAMRREAQATRLFYSTPEGRKELQRLIIDCHVFDTIDASDFEALALRNYAIKKLYLMGILLDSNIDAIIDNLLAIGQNEED